MGLSSWLAGRVAPGHLDPHDLDARARVGLLEGAASVVVNALLSLFKIWLGLASGSVAVMADALHTLSDSLTSLVVIVGFRLSRRPSDMRHPFGHGRSESIAAVVVSVLLAVAAIEMARTGIARVLSPLPIRVDVWIVSGLAATVLVKLALTRFSFKLGRLIGSNALAADAWHHAGDAFSTLFVIVAFAGPALGVEWLDGAMAMGVSLLIGWTAVQAMRGAAGPLIGESAPLEMYRHIAHVARSHEGVLGVHDILVHRYGGIDIISLHIEVSDSEKPIRLHTIAERIERDLSRVFPGHALVHIDPISVDHPKYVEVRSAVEEAVKAEECCQSFHDLRIFGGTGSYKVAFDLSTSLGYSRRELFDARKRIRDRIIRRLPEATVVIDLEPPYLQDAPS